MTGKSFNASACNTPAFLSSKRRDARTLGIFQTPASNKLQDMNRGMIIQHQHTLSSAASASCTLVCVFRFCLKADGNASGCERVVISMFSYAVIGTEIYFIKGKEVCNVQLAGSSCPHCSQVTLGSLSLGRSSNVPQWGQNSRVPDSKVW